MFFRKAFFIVFLMSAVAVLPVLAHAQEPFTQTLNFESSKLPYNWHTSAWTLCSGECNDGTQSRDVDCKDNAGNLAPAVTDCDHTPKPKGVRDCNLPDCQWVTGSCPPHSHPSGGGEGGGFVQDPSVGGEVNSD